MLSVQAVSVHYGLRRALDQVSLQVGEGEVVALLGPNGAGKTTLLRALSGLLPLQGGRVELAGRDLSRLAPDRRVRLGLVHVPEGGGVFAPMTVYENLEVAHRGGSRAGLRQGLERVYDLFPILARRGRQLAGSLSGGERQMLAIARGLLSRPRVLMLDEPSLGLAPRVTAEIFAVLRRLGAEGLTVLLVEQNVRMALELAQRVYILDQGQIRVGGPVSDIAGSAVWDQVFLGRGFAHTKQRE